MFRHFDQVILLLGGDLCNNWLCAVRKICYNLYEIHNPIVTHLNIDQMAAKRTEHLESLGRHLSNDSWTPLGVKYS